MCAHERQARTLGAILLYGPVTHGQLATILGETDVRTVIGDVRRLTMRFPLCEDDGGRVSIDVGLLWRWIGDDRCGW